MSRKASSAPEWKFSQVLGERNPAEEVLDVDIISAIEFDKSGKYLATGDNGGRIVLFEHTNEKDDLPRKVLEHSDCCSSTTHPQYGYKTEFQSHESEFDYLRSLEIGEKINKVLEQKVKKVKEMKPNPSLCSENTILAERSFVDAQNDSSFSNGYHLEWKTKLPENSPPSSQGGVAMISKILETCSARCRRVYAHAHDYNINSISNNSDGETYLSADDLRINLWNLEIGDQCFNIIDMEPSDMENLTAEFHPVYCNLLAYGSSRGFIRLVDLRQSALCDRSARILQDHEVHGSRTLLTEIINSISDIKFLSDGRHMLSRDYMNLKLWDLRMEASPVEIF
ncbi:Protein phosphatase 2A [Cinnamomum micranthum f. kanehirae]|uniref:Serine/threonine-protein phosphatase 2A 55 kDa regulatory subunit B n=1 Tax=Cinnamomum micranthum f. kanehirae TaxID=337451 RepID=A0A3S3PMQ5_9MAGN|nr:Protein phosphatase 2A [Cinnamomum micranthum f. kanehirae]